MFLKNKNNMFTFLTICCFMMANFFIASDSNEPFASPKHSYHVPEYFENLDRCSKESEKLKNDGSLAVQYKNNDISCKCIFYPNGELKEVYESKKGYFPRSTMVFHYLNGNKRVINRKSNIDITVSQEELELAKLTLKNTINNCSNYKGYPWEVLFAEASFFSNSSSDYSSSSYDSDSFEE